MWTEGTPLQFKDQWTEIWVDLKVMGSNHRLMRGPRVWMRSSDVDKLTKRPGDCGGAGGGGGQE